MRKKKKTGRENLEELNSSHRRSQAKCQLIQTSYIKRIKLFLFSPYNKHLINRAGGLYGKLLYGSVSQGLGTTKFTNLIG